MSTPDFTKMVPGFDFLQGLMKNAGSALPNMGQWIAPTLDPEELEKRIEQLRTVQFWLEQNGRMLGATVQALEVQRMTLSTLKTMNMPLAEMRKAMELRPAAPAPAPAASMWPASSPSVQPVEPVPPASAAPAAGVVDPMQWWGALTQQFTELAAGAMRDAVAQQPAAAGPTTQDPAAAPAEQTGGTDSAADGAADAKRGAARKRSGG